MSGFLRRRELVGWRAWAASGAACLALAGVVAGCGGSAADAGPSMPQLTTRGGPVMGHPQLVPIFFSDDADADTLTQFNQWIVASVWLAEVGTEYGVGTGSVLGVVHRATAAPLAITDDQVVDLVFSGLADGSIPKPAGGDLGDVLYMVYFPPQTIVTAGSSTSCAEFGGYHASARRNGVEIAYAVLPTCPGFIARQTDLQIRELVSSHELIEAATDPFPGNRPGFQLTDPTSPWLALGGEVGDMCTRGDPSATWNESGFVAQRSWSNAAAADGKDPCVPGQEVPYFNVFAALDRVPRIPPGGHLAIQLTGFAPDAGNGFGWQLEADPAMRDEATLMLGTTEMSTRTTSTIDVALPATTSVGKVIRFYVFSTKQATYQVLPMFAVAGDPCSSFTGGCGSCTAHAGCGFCATTGKCEAEGASGSAESACPASSFARWPGSCPGICAAQSGTCAACSSLPGCGWCASAAAPQCMEASPDTYLPASGSCSYADWSFSPNYCPQ